MQMQDVDEGHDERGPSAAFHMNQGRDESEEGMHASHHKKTGLVVSRRVVLGVGADETTNDGLTTMHAPGATDLHGRRASVVWCVQGK